ncbi:protein spinster homolog 1 [Patella vulgata]|uniref:protein spinster homolog 1 n=1 Tax=Patella vulgata TaxID=6465 RepID=UPI00217F819C|nr:protein spinster homolog 1 [Patella vulgata]
MITLAPPFDDTFHLEDMPVDFSDTQLILPNDEDEEIDAVELRTHETINSNGISRKTAYITVATLLLINLLNYMDRFTVAGVLKDVIKYYDLTFSEAGLIQTSFICIYMVFSPIFGYLGDRYTRKYIMACGISLWSLVTLASSFVPSNSFYGFILLRGCVGIGEASYSTIAPTIIADLFSKGMRTKMLMIFYFAIPVGSGLGYIIGSNVAKLLGAWQWALRVTPALGLLCVILILIFCKEPVRGMADEGEHLSNTSVMTDIKELVKCKSYVLSTIGFTCVTFVAGALALWAPVFMLDATETLGQSTSEEQVSLIFGVITVAAGFIGVAAGAESARRYKVYNPRADPLICALGILVCVPFLYFSLVLSQYNIMATWILIFIGETMLCLNWAIVADMLLYVVIPTRRSTAEAFQILLSHAFGDAGSPYLIGLIADAISAKHGSTSKSTPVQYKSLQYSLFTTTFVCVIGGAFFLATAMFIQKDKRRCEQITKGLLESTESLDDVVSGEHAVKTISRDIHVIT